MKSNTRKKLLALFAVGTLAVAGAAWAAVAGGVISTTASETAAADLELGVGAVADNPLAQLVLNNPTVNLLGNTLVASSDFAAIVSSTNHAALNPSGILGNTSYDITVAEGEHLTIRPTAADEAVYATGGNASTPAAATVLVALAGTEELQNAVLTATPTAGTSAAQGAGSGVLRLAGEGTTSIYAAGNNNPNDTNNNTYAGGTLLKAGRLEIAHSYAIGAGPLYVNQGATVAFIDRNSELGNLNANRTDISKWQQIALIRSDDRAINTPLPVYFDVTEATEAGTPLTFVANSRIFELSSNDIFATWRGYTSADLTVGIQLVKQGSGTMTVRQDGAWHKGGTLVEAGTLNLRQDAGLSSRFVGELGYTWGPAPRETVSAKANYNTANALNNPTNAAMFNNNLEIAEGAKVVVNRNQFFANFDGAGAFESDYWIENNANVIPQIAVQLSDYYATGKDSTFSGPITGKMNLVLDNPITNISFAENSRVREELAFTGLDYAARSLDYDYARPRMLSLTGANAITDGDTTVKDGILSINKAEGTLAPGTIRVGINDSGLIHNAAGVADGSASFRGFVNTVNNATLHAKDTFAVPQQTLVMTNDTNNFANLAAVDGKTMSFGDITLQADNRSQLEVMGNHRGILLSNAVRINENYNRYYNNWTGTVAFTDQYSFPGTDGGNRLGIRIRAGKLHLDKEPVTGAALVAVEEGAVLSLGDLARDFTGKADNDGIMDVLVQASSRIYVKAQTTDLYDSLANAIGANGENVIFRAANIDYTGLGGGDEVNRQNRLVIAVDLSNVGESYVGKWIPLVGSANRSSTWRNLFYQRESSTGQTEDYIKVDPAFIDANGVEVDIAPDAYEIDLDETSNTISLKLNRAVDKPAGTPTPSYEEDAAMVTKGADAPTTLAQGAAVNVPFKINPASYDVTSVAVVTTPATAGWTVEVDNAETGDCHIAGTMPDASVTYYLTATTLPAPGTTFRSASDSMTLQGTTPTGSSSGGGCDAGFGAFALLAIAGAAVLRKKD